MDIRALLNIEEINDNSNLSEHRIFTLFPRRPRHYEFPNRARQLTRDERLRCRHYYELGLTHEQIHQKTNYSIRQIQRACATRATPQKRSGRPVILTQAQVEEVIEFVSASKRNRRIPYDKVCRALDLPVKAHALGRALRIEGYHRRIALRKPPISEANRRKRLTFAYAHLDWTLEQWYKVLWTDETWVTGGRHTRTWVTRKAGEEHHSDCIVEREQRKKGWMFWGCFAGVNKGPGIFWEKDWGPISAESYMDYIVPIIHGWIRLNPELILMQDGAPGHRAGITIEDLRERGIYPIEWPPFSPDLNPIEKVWNLMKNYVAENFPEIMSYNRLRDAVKEAWDKVSEYDLKELVDSIHDRCQAVIDANGKHTRY